MPVKRLWMAGNSLNHFIPDQWWSAITLNNEFPLSLLRHHNPHLKCSVHLYLRLKITTHEHPWLDTSGAYLSNIIPICEISWTIISNPCRGCIAVLNEPSPSLTIRNGCLSYIADHECCLSVATMMIHISSFMTIVCFTETDRRPW